MSSKSAGRRGLGCMTSSSSESLRLCLETCASELSRESVPTARCSRVRRRRNWFDVYEAVKRTAPEAIAISLLFSFANPENELAVETKLGELGKPLSVSHKILPEFREYERTSTVVVNAYLQPLMQSYLENDWRAREEPKRWFELKKNTHLRHAIERRDHRAGVGGT